MCSVYAAPDAPQLRLAVEGLQVSATWEAVADATGYRLHYAPYPHADPIHRLDMRTARELSVGLAEQSGFYVAVTAYDKANRESHYSNIEHFMLYKQTSINVHSSERMLVVLAAPSVHDEYYQDNFADIIAFDIAYAQAIMGNDNVVVLADRDTLPYFKDRLPAEVLLEAEVADIWLRDFATVDADKMVKFAYDRPQERFIEQSFLKFTAEHALQFPTNRLKVDGGNVVDSSREGREGRIVLTDKVLERNPDLTESQVVARLKAALDAKEVAIIPMDEPYLGHADGMVMFTDHDTLLMNAYPDDADFKAEVVAALRAAMPAVAIHEINGTGYGEPHGDYASACGIYVNSVVTRHYIYTSTFGNPAEDNAALQKIRALTRKTVVPVDARKVCFLGGNTRCLSWQLSGENARKLIEAAARSERP